MPRTMISPSELVARFLWAMLLTMSLLALRDLVRGWLARRRRCAHCRVENSSPLCAQCEELALVEGEEW
jgi:hypothetical protein